MNLLDKNWLRLLVFAALTIFSCEDSSDIGLDLDPEGIRLDVLYAELPLEAKNVWLDSVRTNADSRLLVGRNIDPIFGDITSKAFCKLFYKNGLVTGDTSLTNDRDERGKQIYFIDSVVLYLQISKVHTSNFSPQQTFNIYQLEDTLFSGAARYLSKFETPYDDSTPEGTLTINLDEEKIERIDTTEYIVHSKLNSSFGEELFSFVEDDESNATNRLHYEYKGIAMVADPGNTALVGFHPSDSSSIRIHYSIRDHYMDGSEELDSLWADSLSLDIGLNSAYYNGLSVDRSGSVMNAQAGANNSFTVGDGNIYLQPISGIYPKINLDTLVNFFEANPNIQINRMEFDIETKANEGTYQDNVSDLRFFYVDGPDGSKVNPTGLITGNFIQTAILSDNGYLAGLANPLVIAPLDETSLTYHEIPTFFAQLVESGSLEVDHVILIPQDATTPDFSIFDQETGFRIKLYYSLPE